MLRASHFTEFSCRTGTGTERLARAPGNVAHPPVGRGGSASPRNGKLGGVPWAVSISANAWGRNVPWSGESNIAWVFLD